MKIAIGCDHIVTDIKNVIVKNLQNLGHSVTDCGTYDHERTHYPIFGHRVGVKVAKKQVDRGIVLCGTGVGISNSANKVKGVRCVLVREPIEAKIAVTDYNANIIAFGGRIVGMGIIERIIDEFLSATYQIKNEKILKEIDETIEFENYSPDIFQSLLENTQKNN